MSSLTGPIPYISSKQWPSWLSSYLDWRRPLLWKMTPSGDFLTLSKHLSIGVTCVNICTAGVDWHRVGKMTLFDRFNKCATWPGGLGRENKQTNEVSNTLKVWFSLRVQLVPDMKWLARLIIRICKTNKKANTWNIVIWKEKNYKLSIHLVCVIMTEATQCWQI